MRFLPRLAIVRYSFRWRLLWPLLSSARCATCRKSAAPARSTAPSARASTMCAWAQTVSTTVRIAGKPATFHWRTPVATEAKSIQMQIEADPRLAAAAGGAARFFADAAGLEAPAITDWQTAIVAACNEAFEHLTREHPRLDLTLTRLADRLEVALSREGDTAPAVGLDTLVGLAPHGSVVQGRQAGKSLVLGGVDRVQYETQGGIVVTRLTKYIKPATPRG